MIQGATSAEVSNGDGEAASIWRLLEAGGNTLIVDMEDGRRLRISVRRSSESGRFAAVYESLGATSWQGREIPVWLPAEGYRASGNTIEECIEQALAAVEAGPLPPELRPSDPPDAEEDELVGLNGEPEGRLTMTRLLSKARPARRRVTS
jgi:hypothetical protein